MRRAPVRAVSRRRAARDSTYPQARRAVYERSQGVCEALASDACSRRCEQVHHRAGRNVPDPHALSNLLGVCASCHALIHARPELARARGWSTSRHAGQPDQPYSAGWDVSEPF